MLDAQRTNSARELQELFFELDAIDQESQKTISENRDAALDAMKKRLERGAP